MPASSIWLSRPTRLTALLSRVGLDGRFVLPSLDNLDIFEMSVIGSSWSLELFILFELATLDRISFHKLSWFLRYMRIRWSSSLIVRAPDGLCVICYGTPLQSPAVCRCAECGDVVCAQCIHVDLIAESPRACLCSECCRLEHTWTNTAMLTEHAASIRSPLTCDAEVLHFAMLSSWDLYQANDFTFFVRFLALSGEVLSTSLEPSGSLEVAWADSAYLYAMVSRMVGPKPSYCLLFPEGVVSVSQNHRGWKPFLSPSLARSHSTSDNPLHVTVLSLTP